MHKYIFSNMKTGGRPQTAIREDASIHGEAFDRMLEPFPNADVVFIEKMASTA